MPKFKLLRGIHNEGGETYYTGDIIDSASDLSKHPQGRARFEPVSDDAAVVTATKEPPLESLTVVQLREIAEELEVDLDTVTRKDEIISALRAEGIDR